MKKIIILSAILALTVQVSWAIPAKKGKIVKVQPDGSRITILIHGDEFLHWTTTEDGTVVAPDSTGVFRPASKPVREMFGGRLASDAAAAAIRAKRSAAMKASMNKGSVTTYHFPVILVQFSDTTFSVNNPQTAFSNLLNQEGYSANGATGSVHDYYWENSMNTFDAVFDVFGPVTLSGSASSYGSSVNYPYHDGSGEQAAKALYQACKALDGSIDFSRYDNDGDGYVDMVFMYYAGHNEAEGASESTIWPHKWSFSAWDYYNCKTEHGEYVNGYSNTDFDGKFIDVYACTSELQGTRGRTMCGIGTCAHEFSHTQGLPDFYDVNYDNYGDGEAGATYHYDIMCSGSYNNSGRTPPYFTAEERIMMGWLDDYADLPSGGQVTIPSVNTNFAYRMKTSNETGYGEYFVFECRSGKGWDAYVEPGLIVYHADKSTKNTVTYKVSANGSYSRTPYEIWNGYTQYVNADGSHPCFYIIPAADQKNLNYGGSLTKFPFPGAAGISFFTPEDWEGNKYDLFRDISFDPDGNLVTMNRIENTPGICGLVQNSSGEPVQGATVSIYVSKDTSPNNIIGNADGIQKISGRILDNLKMSVTTDENGFFSLNLTDYSGSDVDIEVTAKGYITKYETVSITDELQTRNFKMRGIDEPIDYTLMKFSALEDIYGLGYGSTCNTYASICLTADELSEYVGRKILSLTFAYSTGEDGSVSSVYGIIDAGGSRVLTSKVSSPSSGAWNTIDLSSSNLYIEAGKDYHFGYGLLNCTYGYPMLFSSEDSADGGFEYYLASASTSVASSFDWSGISGYGNLLIYVVLDDSSEVDYNYIYNPGYGSYSVGETFALTLVEAEGGRKPGTPVQWFFDDEPVEGEGVVLKYAGRHLVEARFTTTEGKTKVVELEINVNL